MTLMKKVHYKRIVDSNTSKHIWYSKWGLAKDIIIIDSLKYLKPVNRLLTILIFSPLHVELYTWYHKEYFRKMHLASNYWFEIIVLCVIIGLRKSWVYICKTCKYATFIWLGQILIGYSVFLSSSVGISLSSVFLWTFLGSSPFFKDSSIYK